MTLSIIVPVYQVEQYIRACIESIFRQGMNDEDFELILVNDGTMDSSFNEISDIIDCHQNVTIINQENQGLSVARNNGICIAKGDFILFVDSDDILIENSLTKLLDEAIGSSADMVIGDFKKMSNEDIARKATIPVKPYKSISKTGSLFFTEDFDPHCCFVWRSLYRRAFLQENNLLFIPGIFFEDIPFTTLCLLKASICIKTNHLFYIYRQRPGSIVSDINKKKILDFNMILQHLWELRKMELTEAESRQLMNTIFTTFSVEMWYVTHNRKLMSQRNEIVSDLKRLVPDLHFTGGMKERMVSCLFRLMPTAYLWLRSLSS